MNKSVPMEVIEKRILLIRGQKVMLDRDLADLYEVDTRQLKRQVRRNKERFPEDFMIVLNENEIELLVRHFGTPFKSYLGGSKPFAFTEHGILMLSSVINSKRAIQVNIQIMRAFVRLRELISSNKAIMRKIESLENKYNAQFKVVFDAIKLLISPPEAEKKKIGFLR